MLLTLQNTIINQGAILTTRNEGIVIEFHQPLLVEAIKIMTSVQVECSINTRIEDTHIQENESHENISDEEYHENLGSMLDLSERIYNKI